MSAITDLAEGFEGSDGTTITPANTKADNLSGSATAKFETTGAAVGSSSMEVVASGNSLIARFNFTSIATLYLDLVISVESLASGATVAIANWYDSAGSGTGKVGDLRIDYVDGTHYTLELRDNNTSRWTSTNLTIGTNYRVQVKVVPGSATGHRVYIYNTITSDTADQDSGTLTATANSQTAVDNVRLGVISNATTTVRFHDMQGDDAQLVARATSIGSTVAVTAGVTITAAGDVVGATDSLFYKASGSWVVITEKVRSGGSWV